MDRPATITNADGAPLTPPLIDFAQAATYLGVAEETLRFWLARGIGPRSYKIGRHRRFRISDLDAFIEERAEEPGA